MTRLLRTYVALALSFTILLMTTRRPEIAIFCAAVTGIVGLVLQRRTLSA
jgi:hypothetical protein